MNHNKTDIDISNTEEDLSDSDESEIITNTDEFCIINELQSNQNKIQNNNKELKHNKIQTKKLEEPYKISSPIQNINTQSMSLYSLLLNGNNNNNTQKNKKMIKKSIINAKKKLKNINENNIIKKYYDASKKSGKSVFLKIYEDIYTKLKSKPNKEVRDIYKTEEDAYNTMTSDPYIRTCENKENIKNKKIVQQCLDRKAKEDIFKKIGIECDRNGEKKKLHDPKRACSVTDRNINFKSTRTLEQFLRDQLCERKKKYYKNNNNKINKKYKGNILPQDSTFIFNENKEEIYSQFYGFSDKIPDYENDIKSVMNKNDKYKINVEEEKDISNKTFEIDFGNFNLLNTKNEKKNKSNKIYKKSKKNSKDITTTSTSKNSKENITNKFLNLYKEIIEINFGQKIQNDFDIYFSPFLLILYKLGFTYKNYSTLIEMSYDNDTKKMDTMHPSVISDISLSNASSSKNINNNNHRINLMSGKSLEDEEQNYITFSYKNDKEFILAKDAWKILTEKKNFDGEIYISSKKFFLFLISVLDIGDYLKTKKNLKKEYEFFFNDKKIITQFNNMKKYINKYFTIFANNANDTSKTDEKNDLILNNCINSYNSSVETSLIPNNSLDINNKYNIYERNYFNNKNIDNLEDKNSIQLFNEEIKEKDKFFYSINNCSEKSSNTLNFTDINNIENNNHSNLLNNSLTDSSSILDIKKFLNQNENEKMEDEVEIDSFLLENNNKNYFKYNKEKINENSESKQEINKNNKSNNNKKKRFGYIFEIQVENETKKLILKKGENKNSVVDDFCKKYCIKEEEKNKIMKIIDERLEKYNK